MNPVMAEMRRLREWNRELEAARAAAEKKIEAQAAESTRGINERNRLWVEIAKREGCYDLR